MHINVGVWDRLLRFVVGIVLIAVGIWLVAEWWRWILIVIGAILVLTGLFGWCCIYSVFGINTGAGKTAAPPSGGETP
jgi:hypothetical protein